MKIQDDHHEYYQLITGFIGNMPNSYSTKKHDFYSDAIKEWETEYRDRNKGDGNDDYWRKTKFAVQFVSTTTVNFIPD